MLALHKAPQLPVSPNYPNDGYLSTMQQFIPPRPIRVLIYLVLLGIAWFRISEYAKLVNFGVVNAEQSAISSLRTFDVPMNHADLAHSRIGAFVATRTGLYVLVHHGLGAVDEVVHLDQDGRLIEYIPAPNLHGTAVAHSLTVDDSGTLAMFEGVRSTRRIVELVHRPSSPL